MTKQEKRPHVLPLMAITAIITAAIAVGATLYFIEIEDTDPGDEERAHVEIVQTEYGAYSKYTLKADREGTVTASDGSAFLVDGQQCTEFNFKPGQTYILTLYGGATPEAIA